MPSKLLGLIDDAFGCKIVSNSLKFVALLTPACSSYTDTAVV